MINNISMLSNYNLNTLQFTKMKNPKKKIII